LEICKFVVIFEQLTNETGQFFKNNYMILKICHKRIWYILKISKVTLLVYCKYITIFEKGKSLQTNDFALRCITIFLSQNW